MFRFIANLALIVLAALLQLTNYAFIFGIKPNFVLILILILSIHYKDWLKRAILILVAAIILKFGQGIEIQSALFILSALFGMLIVDKFPSFKFVNLLLALVIATFTINIIHFELWTIFKEALYNILIFLGCFVIFKLWQRKYEIEQ